MWILPLSQAQELSVAGGKASVLSQLKTRHFLIPDGFVVTTSAFQACLPLGELSETSTPSRVENLQLTPALIEAINNNLTQLCPQNELVAVRSSVTDEDQAQQSFAGQYTSFLAVPPAQVTEKILQLWQQAFSPAVIAYRRHHHLPLFDFMPAVLVQKMVHPSVSGVAFAQDPVQPHLHRQVINATYGLGLGLVAGEIEGDTYYVQEASGTIETIIGQKQWQYQTLSELETREQLNQHQSLLFKQEVDVNQQNQPCLSESEIQKVAQLTREVSIFLKTPQDIEWCFAQGKLYLLQSRPITTLNSEHNSQEKANLLKDNVKLWDNSNISESYSGVTTPLTFSFARSAYQEVYRQFCKMMGVSQGKIEENSQTFQQMIGLIEGRIYYNLISWYQVLALLPGFKMNRSFMEKMMGVKEGLPPALLGQFSQVTVQEKLKDLGELGKTVFGLIKNHLTLPQQIQTFQARLNQALEQNPDLNALTLGELSAYYAQLQGQLLTHWDAPLINDFFAMIFYGILSKLTQKWCQDQTGTLQNSLISEQKQIISTEPAQRLQKMAEMIQNNLELIETLCTENLESILSKIKTLPILKTSYEEYLEKFSDRCLDELKLESPTLKDNPLIIWRTIGTIAQQKQHQSVTEKPPSISHRRQAETVVQSALKYHPFRQLIFNWILKNARQRIQARENLRFERTRVFGRARQIFLAIGKQFQFQSVLEKKEDIFYLEVPEIFNFINGSSTCTQLQPLVKLRQAEFHRYHIQLPPPDRFSSQDLVYTHQPQTSASTAPNPDAPFLQGIGCSPGIVKGQVRIIRNPQTLLQNQDSIAFDVPTIIVAERTDPGWIFLFASAQGLLIERGSLLSHGAIVSRELNLPAIVGLSGITQWLQDGDWVQFDGSNGKVYRLLC